MTGFWVATYIVLWIIVIALILLLVGMLQQIGALSSQAQKQQLSGPGESAEAGEADIVPFDRPEQDDGPALGTHLPDIAFDTANGFGRIRLSAEDMGSTLLVCLQPLCEGCQTMVDPLNRLIATGEYTGRVVVLLRANEREAQAFLKVFPVRAPVAWEGAREFMMSMDIHYNPFALLYDGDGVLVNKAVTRDIGRLQALLGTAPISAPAQKNSQGISMGGGAKNA